MLRQPWDLASPTDHGDERTDVGTDPSTTWHRRDLAHRVCRSLLVGERVLRFLGDTGYRDDDEIEDSFGPDKPFAETAMLLHVASGVRGFPDLTNRVAGLTDSLARRARAARTACAIALHPSIALQLAMPHVLLTRLGHPDARFDEILALSTQSSGAHGREVVPHRMLERMWIMSLWTRSEPGSDFDVVTRRSVLNHPLDLIWGTREDAYAHTHTFMYFTNFGYSRRQLPRPRPDILDESAVLLARSLLLGDFDLAGEVLMAWPLTGEPWSPTAAFGFRVLADLEDRVGFLPAKNGTPAKFVDLVAAERTKYALASSYHTAYVMGMLCALALRAEDTLPTAFIGREVPRAVVDELLAVIGDDTAPWRVTFDRLGADEQRRLGSVLMDMALLTSARGNDYATVASLLGRAVQHGLAGSPLCAQAAQLLHRVAVGAQVLAG